MLLPVLAFHPQELGDGFAMCVVLGIERSQFDAEIKAKGFQFQINLRALLSSQSLTATRDVFIVLGVGLQDIDKTLKEPTSVSHFCCSTRQLFAPLSHLVVGSCPK